MKLLPRLLLASLLAFPAALLAASDHAASVDTAPAGYPLRGVVTRVLAESKKLRLCLLSGQGNLLLLKGNRRQTRAAWVDLVPPSGKPAASKACTHANPEGFAKGPLYTLAAGVTHELHLTKAPDAELDVLILTFVDQPTSVPPDAPQGHPLKGVIVDILPARSALLVKHEEIPGYMKAMTMLLKVDVATLQSAAKGQAITATLVKRADGFWLEDVKVIP
jgi:Cu/Ag efflux protein CusF